MPQRLEYTVLDLIESAARTMKAQPLNLGGLSGTGGGVGAPPAGYIGQLPQTRVAYDETEAATLFTPASGMSLLDNLNHIRYRLDTVESGILIVDDWDGSPTIQNVTELTFSGAIVTQVAPGHALVVVSGGTGSPLTMTDFTTTVNNVDSISVIGATVIDLGAGDALLSIPYLIVEEVDGSPSVSNVTQITFSGATVTDMGAGEVLVRIAGGGGFDVASGDARYLKLDASNDPLTGTLEIEVDDSSDNPYGMAVSIVNTDPFDGGLYIEAEGTAGWFIANSDTGLYMDLDLGGSDTGAYGILFERLPRDNTVVTYAQPVYYARDHKGTKYGNSPISAVYNGGTLRHEIWSGGSLLRKVADINPYAAITDKLLYFRSENAITESGRLISLENQGVEKFSVDGNGLVNIASGQTYNINNTPHMHFNDAEGDPADIGIVADGTSTYAARRDHVHATANGSAALSAHFDITASDGVYQDTGLSVTLPSAGTYMLDAVVRGIFQANAAGGYIVAKLYNSTDAADVANTFGLVVYYLLANQVVQETIPISTTVTVAASKVIKLYAMRQSSGATMTLDLIGADANGLTSLRYVKIG